MAKSIESQTDPVLTRPIGPFCTVHVKEGEEARTIIFLHKWSETQEKRFDGSIQLVYSNS
jgi:hypothetical protein